MLTTNSITVFSNFSVTNLASKFPDDLKTQHTKLSYLIKQYIKFNFSKMGKLIQTGREIPMQLTFSSHFVYIS